MAACINFTRIGQKEPISLNALDAEIAKSVGDEVHQTKWCRNWFNVIGFELSAGKNFKKVRNFLIEIEYQQLLPVLDYIENNFTYHTWHE